MNSLVFHAASEADTDRLGVALAAALPSSAVIALNGTLGAGKTRLVQGLAAACGIDRADVVSPTFVLLAKYAGNRVIYHLDAYRLKDEDELYELGFDELLDSEALTIIEWAGKVPDCLPDDRLEIQIDVTGPTTRQFTLRAAGPALAAALQAIARCLGK